MRGRCRSCRWTVSISCGFLLETERNRANYTQRDMVYVRYYNIDNDDNKEAFPKSKALFK
jgi:hypothetical protein